MFGLQKRHLNRLVIVVLMMVQTFTHLGLLSSSGQVGQFAIPYLMNRGLPLYTTVIETRAPGTALVVSLLMRLFPAVEQVLLVRALNLVLILSITLLVAALAQRLSTYAFAGSAAALVWFIWEPTYANILAYFDVWVGMWLVLAALVALNLERSPRPWLVTLACGVVLGLAATFKQPAWASVILFGAWLVLTVPRLSALPSRLSFFVLGVAIPTLGVLAGFAAVNAQADYWFWNFQRYASGVPNRYPLTGPFFRKILLTNAFVPVFTLNALRQMNRQWLLVVLLWLAGCADMLQNFGEVYVMGHLPLMCVMSGIALLSIAEALSLADLRRPWAWLQQRDTGQIALIGLLLAIMVGWAWTAAVIYGAQPLSRGKVLAYDEFKPLAEQLAALMQPDDTLFVLPMSDGNAQLYILLNALPPGTWSASHPIFLDVKSLTDRLVEEWTVSPPTWMVVFPDQVHEFQPGIDPLMAFVDDHYTLVEEGPEVPFNGQSLIYKLKTAP